jgi:hypothetical protein
VVSFLRLDCLLDLIMTAAACVAGPATWSRNEAGLGRWQMVHSFVPKRNWPVNVPRH